MPLGLPPRAGFSKTQELPQGLLGNRVYSQGASLYYYQRASKQFMPRKSKVREQSPSVALVSDVVSTPSPSVSLVSNIDAMPSPGGSPASNIDSSITPGIEPISDSEQSAIQVPEKSTVQLSEKSASLSALASKPSKPPLPKFGSYELVWEICKDALSTTWAATREGIERPLALRIFNARVTDSAQVRSIQRAARKAAELTHVNCVTVYENGVGDDGAPYVVTEWAEGDTLAETFIVKKRLDIASFLNIFEQVGDALTEAHSRQLIHGNLSPNKIILVHSDEGDPETVKLIDFGMPPDPVQNAYYLSPEQCLDRNRANERSDVYSLGCIMYESLVGTPPFIGDQVSQASTNYLHELANHYDKTAPEHNALKLLDCIIVKCLQKKPAKRFRNVRELMDALRLVNDCIVDGSQRKLPRKAEKLLLFRFLDFFDKKILTCMSAYLILGLVSVAYIGELQLQKYIDEAQLAGALNVMMATSNWKAALKQAQLSNKPPSLQADLHWELADSLKREFDEAKNPVSRNAIADEARKHYEEAFNYFSHGAHYRSYALTLLHNISSMYMAKEDPDLMIERKAAAVKQLKTLFHQKKYTQCAKAAKDYLTKFDDEEVAYYAGCSNNEIGTTLPSKDALRFFERSEYYFQQAGKKVLNSQNRATCLHELGLDASQPGTALAMGCRALEDGDLAAAEAEFSRATAEPDVFELLNGLGDYQRIIVEINRRAMTSIDTKNAIKPLELALEIEQKAYGMNHSGLGLTLGDLARCYRNCGEKQKALDTYKRMFTIVPREDQDNADVLTYVDLLASTGHKAEARKELEKRALNDSSFYSNGTLYIRLIEAYGTDKMKDRAHKLINKYITDPKPVKLVTYEQYYGRPSTPNDPF